MSGGIVVEHIHRLASGTRNSRALRRHTRLWHAFDPLWERSLDTLLRERGYLARVNGDPLRLTYRYGARYEKHGYEPAVHAAFTTKICPGMVVLDVGAHVGFFALAAGYRVGKDGRVYAFEPAPQTAALLDTHVRMNEFEDRVEVVRRVVGDQTGEIDFYVRGETMAAAVFRGSIEVLSPERSAVPATAVRATATTLDAFCGERRIVPDRIKIDVEGAELAVLRGAARVLAGRADILCEIHPSSLEALGGSSAEVDDLLCSGGRTCERVGEPNRLGIYHLLSRRDR